MKPKTSMRAPLERAPLRASFAALLVLALAAGLPLLAQSVPEEHPGYVSPDELLALVEAAEERGADFLEVDFRGPALRLMARSFSPRDPELGHMLLDLVSVRAVIVEGLDDDAKREAGELVKKLRGELRGAAWRRSFRAREEGERIEIYMLSDEERVSGLTVLIDGRDAQGRGEIVFVNLAGTIDVEGLSRLGEAMNLPGLDQVKEGGADAAPGERGRGGGD